MGQSIEKNRFATLLKGMVSNKHHRDFIARRRPQGDDRSTIDTDASAAVDDDAADDDLVNHLEIERHPCFRNGFQFFFWVLSVATTKTRRWTSTCSTCRPTT